LLKLGEIEEIMNCLSDHFRFAQDTEITIEANPGDLTSEKITGIRSLGFNRINMGVQSFDDRDLHFLGRRHRAGDAEKALKRLRSHGFENVGVDLIYGLERQTLKAWMETLKRALLFQPEHLSCYQLTLEKRTPFWRMKEKGAIRPLDEEKERDFFLATSDFLEDNGYIHYEISSFARGEDFYSRHNLKYWYHIPYLGLGPSAHSFQGSTRWWNLRSIKGYCKSLGQGRAPVEGDENLTEDQIRLESISLGLRTKKGFDLKEIKHNSEWNDTISSLRDSGFIRIENNRVLPTRKGFLVADRLPLYFPT